MSLQGLLASTTPGPWIVRETAPWDVLTEWEENDPIPRGRLIICEHAGVDASLIALAPDAVALLVDMAKELESGQIVGQSARRKKLLARFAALNEKAAA